MKTTPPDYLCSITTKSKRHEQKEAKFVIFHGSYPYMAELTILAKRLPNVYNDMCWMHIISPPASKQYLEEWLLTVPSNKIMAFGGDFGKKVGDNFERSE